MHVLYEDADLVVCEKPVGVLSQPDLSGQGEDMLSLLREYLSTNGGQKSPYVGLIHRLDRGVGGLMVFAKNERAAAVLSTAVASQGVTKQYLAVVHGCPDAPRGIWQDFLYKDSAKGKSFVVDRQRRGVKMASLAYCTLQTLPDTPYGPLSLLQIRLHTGRTHQIRVQCSSRGMPLVGDGKYGARDHGVPIGLYSCALTFEHPCLRGQTVEVRALPTAEPFSLFSSVTLEPTLPGMDE